LLTSAHRCEGDLGLLGITVPAEYGGSEMDATAAVIAHEELAASDPAFCLSFLAHSMLFVNNLTQVPLLVTRSVALHSLTHVILQNGSHEQKMKYLPDTCSGAKIGGMGMSEPAVGTDVLGMTVCF
jgi:isovaleryl-CoA dehydrogenase